MTLPASRSRILAALRRLSPVWPDTSDDTSVGKELGSCATAIGLAADCVDTTLDEAFPTSTVQLIDRWERVTRNPVRPADDIAVRRARVLGVMRKLSGPRIDQLGSMLIAPLDIDISDLLFIEQTRELVEPGMINTLVADFAITGTPSGISMGKPWPGLVDDTGVSLYLAMTTLGTPTVTLTSPLGTVWTVPVTAAIGWVSTRDLFVGEPAGGLWTVSVANGSAVTLSEVRLLVSNDVDAAQIYNFFAYRDPDLAGTPDILDGQRLFHRTALGHMNSHVIERMAFVVDDEHSLVDREPVGT